MRIVAAAQVPADQMLEIGDVGHQRAGELVLHTALRQCRRQEVGDRREAWGLFVPRPAGREARPPGTARACVEDRQDFLAAVQERGPVEVAERFQVAASARLSLGDGHEQIVADHLAQRPVLAPRLVLRAIRASRRAISKLRRLSWCRPGSRRQRSSSARWAIDSMKVSHLGFGPGRSIQLGQTAGEMIGHIEQVAERRRAA